MYKCFLTFYYTSSLTLNQCSYCSHKSNRYNTVKGKTLIGIKPRLPDWHPTVEHPLHNTHSSVKMYE